MLLCGSVAKKNNCKDAKTQRTFLVLLCVFETLWRKNHCREGVKTFLKDAKRFLFFTFSFSGGKNVSSFSSRQNISSTGLSKYLLMRMESKTLDIFFLFNTIKRLSCVLPVLQPIVSSLSLLINLVYPVCNGSNECIGFCK